MTTGDFAQRHGCEVGHRDFESPDYLPDDVREQAAIMMVESYEDFVEPPVSAALAVKEGMAWPHIPAYRRFAKTVRDSLPPSQENLGWYRFIMKMLSDSSNLDKQKFHRISPLPLTLCDWRLFYTVVECVCTEWRPAGTHIEESFATDFNYLLSSHRIPWMLQGGWVIPVADLEFAEDLKYVRQAEQLPNADIVTNPLVSLKNAFDALYRKQGGPDITGACNHAWGAWETARQASGGINKVKSTYPELWQAITAWKDRIHAGRHPGKKLGRLPTESETRFIVGLCVNAVRLLSSSPNSEDVA